MRVATTVILLLLPLIAVYVARYGNSGARLILTGVILLLTVGGIILASASNVYYISHDYHYEGDYYWLTVYGAQAILKGKNPYLEHHLGSLRHENYFGVNIVVLNGTHRPVVPTNIKYRFPEGNGFTKYIEHGKVRIIDFYDYPPMLAILAAIPIKLGLPPGAIYNFLFIVAVLVLILRLSGWEQRTMAVTALVGAYALSTVAFSAFSNSAPYVAFLILMISFLDRPVVSGILAGLAFMSMPQATLFLLFWVVYLMGVMKVNQAYITRYITGAIIAGILIALPFMYPHPITTIKHMFFPILAHLINNEYHGIGVANILTLNYGVSTVPFKLISIVLSFVLPYAFWKKAEYLKDFGLLLPVYIFFAFPRTVIPYVVFYFLLAFVAWVVRNYGPSVNPKHH